MLKDPEGFILEKLSKKVLSPNTVRDAVIAAFLITLQKKAEEEGRFFETNDWRRSCAEEIRDIMVKTFAEINAPSEYPSLPQLRQVKAALECAYHWDQISESLKADFEARCEALFKKLETGL